MPTFGFWRAEEKSSKPKKKHRERPSSKIISIREKLHPVFHAPGVYVSPQNHYSTHVYLIFHRYEDMKSGLFSATISFRTMYNDFKGMKTVDISPNSEEADAQFDINGGEMKGVMGSRRMFVCKIGWVQRNENRVWCMRRLQECLPFPVRPDTMDSVEWEELRMKGIRDERHAEVKKMSGVGDFEDEKRAWKRRVDRATRHFDHSGDVLAYRETLKELGPEPGLSSEAKQARYLDKIMNDVGAALYSKHEEPSKFSDKYRRRGE
ncbi:065d0869-f10c-4109-99b9-7c137176fe2e [Sclerotinia trifoliorum]|uniref:065d0869-f10c-4109-99b9-7c137176fe2e n=1 Tax=Sclerotinia trifoliorum TaxID=28548 RepID=A0A8H2ZLQ5_9HELO|nr:065d0869-f10c-4109-99b9-7c137176fe2e [Sclerotinia trifoliorum]